MSATDLKIGEVEALIAQASTPDEARELRDGQSGDTDFPFIGSMKALATVGELDADTGLALTGYPDGIAAFLAGDQTVRVVYQSESYGLMSNQTYPWEMANGTSFTGSHIHYIDYNRASFADFLSSGRPASDMVEGSGHLFHTIYNQFGLEVDAASSNPLAQVWGNQAMPDGTLIEFVAPLQSADFFFQSFCGATYEQANKYGDGMGFADDVWLAAEEWNIQYIFPGGNADSLETVGLASVVVDVENGVAYTAPALGQSGYEKILPINPLSEDYVVLVMAGYNFEQEPAPLKIYVGRKDVDADGNAIDYATASERDAFLAQNGLLHGKIYGMAVENSAYGALGITDIDATAKMFDAYMRDAGAADTFDVRFYATDYQWGGFDETMAVKDTEISLWDDADQQPTGYTFFNGDTKVEHPAADPDISNQRWIQNMTDEGGMIGVTLTDFLEQIQAAADAGNLLPEFVSAEVKRIVPAVDDALTLETGDKGIGNGLEGTTADETAAIHIEAGAAKMVAPDGLMWVKTAEGDLLIVDEDSGNDLGERKYVLSIDPETLELIEDNTGYFLAQAGGADNPRAEAGAAAYPGTFLRATSSEFSGSWDVTALIATKPDGSFYTEAELAGTGAAEIQQATPLAQSAYIGTVQHAGESAGAVAANLADHGGQIFMFNMVLPPEAMGSQAITALLPQTDASLVVESANKIAPASEAGEAGAEIVKVDGTIGAATNGIDNRVELIDVSDANAIVALGHLDIASMPSARFVANGVDLADLGGITSVDIKGETVVATYTNASAGANGFAVIYTVPAGNIAAASARIVEVGSHPDSVLLSADGATAFIANEGEVALSGETYVDGKGSISVIDTASGAVTSIGFEAFDSQRAELVAAGVRINPEADSVSSDLEPEYLALSDDGATLFVTLQENNAVARVDVSALTAGTPVADPASVITILPLGTKDHSVAGNGMDASDRDGEINIAQVAVKGLYMPDTIASYSVGGTDYFVIANEGDGRGDVGDMGEKGKFGDEARVKDLGEDGLPALDAEMAALLDLSDAGLGRLAVSVIDGDTDGDGDIDVLHSFGARSFSIFDADGNLVFDSGDDLEAITANRTPWAFNDDDGDDGENRSDAKGPEPEALEVFRIGDETFAAVGLERMDAIALYNITNPEAATFVDMIDGRALGDISPESIEFYLDANGNAALITAHEISGDLRSHVLQSAETVDGRGDGTVIGTAQGDHVQAGHGNDIVALGGGTDTYAAGALTTKISLLREADVALLERVKGDVFEDGAPVARIETGSGIDYVQAELIAHNGGTLGMAMIGGTPTLTGTTGDDVVFLGVGQFHTVLGAGDDEAFLGKFGNIVDLGAGDDYAALSAGSAHAITLGAGADTVALRGLTDAVEAALADFDASEDVLDLSALGLEAGDVALAQSGADVVASFTAGDHAVAVTFSGVLSDADLSDVQSAIIL